MPSTVQAALELWSLPVPVTLALVLAVLVYSRGWFRLRGAFPSAIPLWRAGAFTSGVLFLWIAVGSPLAAFDDEVLTIHMIQHVLLMIVVPPLILLGAPALPFLHGLPRRFIRGILGPFLRWPPVQELGRTLAHPGVCWLVAMVALIGWHVPAVFQLALRSDVWHEVEHTCFFTTGLLFWWPVIQPWPSIARWPRWCIPLYLFLATLPCDALSAFLVFCDRVVYPYYLTVQRPFTLSPLLDQEFAGALMWVSATFAYLIPAVIITIQILSPFSTMPAQQTQGGLDTITERPLSAEVKVI
jgi:putative membrane protein